MGHVDLYVRNTMWTVGEDYFLHSFFSTIAYQVAAEAGADVEIRPFDKANTYTYFVSGGR
jgi:hypothetical protein